MFHSVFIFYIMYVQEKRVNLAHIESRRSKGSDSDCEIFLDCNTDREQLRELTQLLRKQTDIIETTHSIDSTLPADGRN